MSAGPRTPSCGTQGEYSEVLHPPLREETLARADY